MRIFNKLAMIPRKAAIWISGIYNRLKFRAIGVSLGSGARLTGRIFLELRKGAAISAGQRLHISGGMAVNRISRNLASGIYASEGASIVFGDNVGISASCIWARESIVIGNNVNIGADCVIMDHDGHSLNAGDRRDYCIDSQHIKSKPVRIEDDAFIGARCIILKGVTIGRASVVGAGSVVRCNVPSGEIWAGNPAVFIRKTID